MLLPTWTLFDPIKAYITRIICNMVIVNNIPVVVNLQETCLQIFELFL